MPFKESRLVFVNMDRKGNMPTIESESFSLENQVFQEKIPDLCNRELYDYLEVCGDEKLRNVIIVETDEGEMPLVKEIFVRLKKSVDSYIKRNTSLLSRMWSVGKEVDITSNIFEEMVLSMIREIIPKICREVYLELDNERLTELTMLDELTGLPNRRAYKRQKVIEIAYSERNGPLTLLIFDIDHFKPVNDEHGHLAGDQVLKEMAKRIQNATRDADFVCRWGGEEFVVLMRNTSIEGGKLGAARIRESITREPYEIQSENGETVILEKTVSIGGATFTDLEQDPTGELMEKDADNCLYILKGERPDTNGDIKNRRGRIAFHGRVVAEEEITQLQKVLSNRDKRGKIVSLKNPEDE